MIEYDQIILLCREAHQQDDLASILHEIAFMVYESRSDLPDNAAFEQQAAVAKAIREAARLLRDFEDKYPLHWPQD